MHDQELLGIQERLGSLIQDIYGTSGLMGRVVELEVKASTVFGDREIIRDIWDKASELDKRIDSAFSRIGALEIPAPEAIEDSATKKDKEWGKWVSDLMIENKKLREFSENLESDIRLQNKELIKKQESIFELNRKVDELGGRGDQEHLQQILMDKQRAGMLRVKELEIRDNMVERSMLLEKIKDLEIKLRNSNRDLEIEKQAAEALKAQPRINHEELEGRLDSISQILFCAFEEKRKHKLREAMEISAGVIRLLINDIQFPLVNKDIFKPGSRPQKFHDLPAYEVLRSDDDELADYESEGYYSEYEEDEDDLG